MFDDVDLKIYNTYNTGIIFLVINKDLKNNVSTTRILRLDYTKFIIIYNFFRHKN